jgi:SsrA-binding protein
VAEKEKAERKDLEVNKKARRDYEILEVLEAGISLLGSELKSMKNGGLSLQESYIQIKKGEVYLTGAHIAPYVHTGIQPPDPYRSRKLLLHKREIEKLSEKIKLRGLTLVPLKAYQNEKGRIKLEIALGKGKKLHDKRADVKSKAVKRSLERVLKQR